jgi:membrane protease subunit (stomatin/prohibitin family)
VDRTGRIEGILAYRYPMEDMEIQNGGKLTVRDSQMAIFVNEGQIADVFQPGLYTLTTQTLPILTYLRNWDKAFKSPFKSDVYYFSTHLQINQKWGTTTPITIRDKEFGAVRLRATESTPTASTTRRCSTKKSAARAKPTPSPIWTASCATPSWGR